MLTNVSYSITYRRSTVIKYMYNIHQENALSGNISPALALFAKNHLGFTVPTTGFIRIKEIQHERYLIDNKLSLNQYIEEMYKNLSIC